MSFQKKLVEVVELEQIPLKKSVKSYLVNEVETESFEQDGHRFGKFRFTGSAHITETKPYIRIDYSTEMKCVWKVLIDYWKMNKPKLLISVTGGAKNFEFKHKWKETVLKIGIVKAAASTNGWIITGGTATGVMKLIGDAVRDYTSSVARSNKNKIVALGIATWGVIAKKDDLRQQTSLRALTSNLNVPVEGKANLDANHTHFLLVDDGTESKFGSEIKFRSDLEAFISQKTRTTSDMIIADDAKIPLILLVIEGGANTLQTVLEAIDRDCPILVIDGTGRVADLIAEAYKKMDGSSDIDISDLKIYEAKIKNILPKKYQDQSYVEKVIKQLKSILDKKDHVNIFDLENSDVKDVERAILQALFKANPDVESQLKLALALDHSNLAQQIFSSQNHERLKKINLQEFMMKALKENQPNFVKMFLENGIELNQFLTSDSLQELYKGTVLENDVLLHKFPSKCTWKICCDLCNSSNDEKSIADVSKLICSLMENNNMDFCKSGERFENPERELFLWAILSNRLTLAKLFWYEGTYHLGSALVACCLLNALASIYEKNEEMEISAQLRDQARHYEALAIAVLSECYKEDKNTSHKLLVEKMKIWGDSTLLSLAAAHGLMQFMGHTCCQTKLNIIWKGHMSIFTGYFRVFLTYICPFLVFNLKFVSQKNGQKEYMLLNHDESVKLQENRNQNEPESQMRIKRQTPRPWRHLYYFYTAPVTKFYGSLISYLIMLIMLTIFVLTDLHYKSVSTYEYLTRIWIGTMILEEARQINSVNRLNFWLRFKLWFSNNWNKFDLVLYIMFVISFVVSHVLNDTYGVLIHRVYSITMTMSYIRFMQFFYVSQNIGPKVIMINKMLTDLKFFILIFIVFVTSFGTAYQANLYPNSELSWNTVKNIVYLPYWQMYGELSLEVIEGKENVDNCIRNPKPLQNNEVRCIENTWLVPALSAIYMILISILLVNLLIAMFSYTFQKVQDNSQTVWKFYRYSLIHEFYDRPTLPPPLIIINHFIRAIRCVFEYKRKNNAFEKQMNEKENEELRAFERQAVRSHLLEKSRQEKESQDKKISIIAENVEKIKNKLVENLCHGSREKD